MGVGGRAGRVVAAAAPAAVEMGFLRWVLKVGV